MRIALLATSALFALMSSGCSVSFYGSAPAPGGKVYVVGGKQGFFASKSRVWLCPAQGNQAECEDVEVITE